MLCLPTVTAKTPASRAGSRCGSGRARRRTARRSASRVRTRDPTGATRAVRRDAGADSESMEATMTSTDLNLEVVTLNVTDIDRAKGFYQSLGWRLDADFAIGDDFRVVQFTPPRSQCSIHFGKGLTTTGP